jgi:hypothetical protein
MSLIITQGYGRRLAIMTPLDVEIDAGEVVEVAVAITEIIEVNVTVE